MKVGIDARFWSQTGVGRYIREIVGALAILDTVNTYIIFLLEEDYDLVSLPLNFKKIKTNILWHTFAEQTILPIKYLQEHLDVLLVLNFNIPIFYPKTLITTVHDLTLLRTRTGNATKLPYLIYTLKYLAGCLTHLIAVKKSKFIFTVSNHVKKDIVKTFKVNPDKIVLTPNAVGESFYRRSSEDVMRVLQKHNIQTPYLFYVGNACVHKNLPRLLKAFELVAKSNAKITLVLGGKMDFNYTRLVQQCVDMGLQERVRFTGYISEDELPSFYSGAECYVNPSMYEGFGIQILEAFACGCKVVCSNTTSLPEVGGDLADYFDPLDTQNIAEVIKLTLTKHDSYFADKAKARVREFSWQSSARAILETIKAL